MRAPAELLACDFCGPGDCLVWGSSAPAFSHDPEFRALIGDRSRATWASFHQTYVLTYLLKNWGNLPQNMAF